MIITQVSIKEFTIGENPLIPEYASNSEINFYKTVLEFFGIEVINMSENVDSQAGGYV